MFKLKKVEMLGFKSFADRTRLEFADGVAAVVGPNGCGKSNLSDSISWVLGEQSARMLRGERMSDVIFNGTGLRPPTGMAEVSLTLINPEYVGLPDADSETLDTPQESELADQPELIAGPDTETAASTDGGNGNGNGNGHGNGAAPSAVALLHRAGEIVVTRRLFRSGESEYLINGETCRLRDIQDLFMGTGLGPESYAIIEQGRIGQILSSKPADRRAIIEEAAGVSKFKTRKRLAEAKLESSRTNLARITDILDEVTKQVNSLKRQASKARRYREMHDELRGRLKIVLTSRLRALDAESSRLRAEVAALQQQSAVAAQQLEEIEREHKTATARHEQYETELAQARELAAQIELERQRLASRVEQIAQQVAALEARAREAAAESEQLQAQADALEAEAAQLNLRAEAILKEASEARQSVESLAARREDLAGQLSNAETTAENSRQTLLAAVSGAAGLRNQLVQAEEAGLALERHLTRTEAERSSAEQEDKRLAGELESFVSEHQRGQDDFESLSRSHEETARALETARQEETAQRGERESLRRDLAAASARKQALEESLAQHAYTTESVRRLLQAPPNGHNFKPLGLLADFVEVSSGYEDVVGEFLKHDLDCVVVEGHEDARSGIALLQSQGSGRSTFFVKRVASNGYTTDKNIGNARIVARVRDLVRFESRLGLNGDFTLPALEHAYVVEDSAAAEQLAAEHPDCHFLTKTGEHYHHRLVSGGKGSSTGPLALRRDFRELEHRALELNSRVGDVENKLAQTTELAAKLDNDLRRLTAARQEAEKKTVLSDEKLRQAREAGQRARERFEVLSQEAATISQERQGVLERQASLRAQLDAATREQAQCEQEIAQATESVREFRRHLDAATQDLSAAQARSSTLEERSTAIQGERSRLVTQLNEVRTRLARLAEQLIGWNEEQKALSAESESGTARMSELDQRQEIIRTALRETEAAAAAARVRRDELAPRIESARMELDASREKRSSAEIALARAESDQAHHAQQCRDELNAEPAQLLQDLAPEAALEGEGLRLAEEEVRGLKTRIENLGPVNMMALEELQESEERFSFLETQRQDLLASIEDTAQAIKEIDLISKQQFMEAFKAINENFAVSFKTLFGGGIGQMRLSDESDPDSGLDIVAQPPGKRLQNVLLLSGGEKALAALALLIAVFRFTPSPFCILDEVDAPLDESNVDRFTRMIREMSRHTQFILITHNKRTMEIAQLLYGVTMEEPGVSKMVSVRFDEVVNEPEAVPA